MKEPTFQATEAVLDIKFYRDWSARRRAVLDKQKEQRTFFITVSREFGCEGFDVAQKIAEKISGDSKTPWNLFTHKMIEKMVAGSGDETVEMVRDVSERRWSFKDWFVDALVPNYLQSPATHVFEGMRNVILNLADTGNCVILGSGAQIITHRLDQKKFMGVHIRVAASKSWRINRVQKLFGLNRENAERLIDERQDTRNKFVADFTGMDPNDPSMYHVTYNNAYCSADDIATGARELLKSKGWKD